MSLPDENIEILMVSKVLQFGKVLPAAEFYSFPSKSFPSGVGLSVTQIFSKDSPSQAKHSRLSENYGPTGNNPDFTEFY